MSSASPFRRSPSVWIFIFIVKGLQLFLFLAFAQLLRIGVLEMFGGNLSEPLGIDGGHFAHVLLGSLHKLVVDAPLGSLRV